MDRASKVLLGGAIALQCAHVATQLLVANPVILSNVLQTLVSLLAAGICLYKATRASAGHERHLWMELVFAFVLWTTAQLFYLSALCFKALAGSALLSSTLWLLFAFPLVLVASSAHRISKRDPVAWLDTAQTCVFFITFFALVFPRPGILQLSVAYQLQSVILLLAFILRYSAAERGLEREFYRPLVIFSALYALFSVLAYTGWRNGLAPGSFIDLCWSLPFTAFSVAAVLAGRPAPSPTYRQRGGFTSPSHLRGMGALGLAVTSLGAASVLAFHHTAAGAVAGTAVFLLFAARTSTREWQLHTAHQGLEHAALHDPLTGLGNRSLLQRDLGSRLKSDRPDARQRTALLFIDLDRFKTINDGLGHAFGDLLLIRVAELLCAAVRPQDIVARHGGDEFVVLLEQVDEIEAQELAERVVQSLREPMTLDGRVIHVTASIGVVVGHPGATADGMLQTADCAMYQAKGGGKDRMQAFAPSMLAAAKEKLERETDLREALRKRTIEVHYQPIYNLPDMSILGFEALARWRHPKRGIILPADFIAIAEDTGLIIELGRQVLQQACQQCQNWNLRFGVPLRMSVNVSAHQFALPGLLDEIATILHIAELHPSLLRLEITESVLLSGYQEAEEVLARARALGIGVCLDDFGTGYSSLSYLLHFPFDVVKIDRSFVQNIDHDERRAKVVRMVIELAATLNKRVIAEGVESAGEFDKLGEFGCDMVQGFLMSRPLLAREVDALLLSAAAHNNQAWLATVEQTMSDRVSPWLIESSAARNLLPKLPARADPRGIPTTR
jgi:diguanylate cyclase (GGDEF)-like protein